MASTNLETTAEKTASPEGQAAKKRRRRIIIIVLIIIIILLLWGFYLLFSYYLSAKPTKYGEGIDVNQPAEVNNNIKTATTTILTPKEAEAIAWSENFDLMQINLEGSGTNVFDFSETEILVLNNVASELFSVKEGEKTEIRALISCQTNKRAYIEVEYQKSGEKDRKIIKDNYWGFNHILVLPALDPDSVYKYSVSATDLSQDKIYSEQFVFYTGAGNISLVDVLGNAVQKVFGWAMGK